MSLETPTTQVVIKPPQEPPQAVSVAPSRASALRELLDELAMTVADLAGVVTQQTQIIRLQGERMDQLGKLLEERDQHAERTLSAMIQTSERMEAMIGEQERAREELGVATAVLSQVVLDLRTMYDLELAEDEEEPDEHGQHQ